MKKKRYLIRNLIESVAEQGQVMVQLSNQLLLVFLINLGITYAAVLLTPDVNTDVNLVVNAVVNPVVNPVASEGPLNGIDNNVVSTETLQLENIDSGNKLTSKLNDANDGLSLFNTSDINSLDNSSIDSLSNITNLTHNAFDNFPPDLMPEWIRNNGGVIFHIFFLVYCCLGLGIICDLYFLPALEIISDTFKLPPDIAGATFMAIGTSAPELFTSIIGVFVSQDDIGVGTILGTAIFNLIVIPAACGFAVMAFCPKTPKISQFPILRDSIFYILTIVTLILCIKDNRVDWVESLIMIGLFGLYLVIMYLNCQYSEVINRIENIDEVDEKVPLLKDLEQKRALEKAHQEWNTFSMSSEYHKRNRSGSQKRIVFADVEIEDEDNWVESNVFCKWFLMPLSLLFKITMPKPTKLCFLITFTFAIVWIGALTYVCVWMVTIIGFTFGLPDTVSGLTLLAAGTSMPELISSVLVVKKSSQADMAICNSIGSNIFDILFCLGVPWLFKSIIWMFQKGTFDLEMTGVPIDSTALPLTTFLLLLSIFALLITFQMTDWKLGFTVGVVCSIIYLIFIVISSTLEISLG